MCECNNCMKEYYLLSEQCLYWSVECNCLNVTSGPLQILGRSPFPAAVKTRWFLEEAVL